MMPEFEHGVIVIVDPSITPTDGSFVVIDCSDSGHVLRQLRTHSNEWTLTTLDDSQADKKIAPDAGAILGVVVQRCRRGRGGNKHYS